MSLNLKLWKGATEATPAFSWVKKTTDANEWSDLGFAVDEDGRVLVYDPEPAFEREIIEAAAERRASSAAPIKKATKRYGGLGARGPEMNVANLMVADFVSSVHCSLQMTEQYLLGSIPWGRLLDPESDDAGPSYDIWEERSGSGIALVWRWPLDKIELIEVSRARRMFKWWDEQISIYSSERRSFFRAERIYDPLQSLPRAQGSSSTMLAFAEALASLVASSKGLASAPAWRVKRDGSDQDLAIDFAPEPARPRSNEGPPPGGGLAGFLAWAGAKEGVSQEQAWRDLLDGR